MFYLNTEANSLWYHWVQGLKKGETTYFGPADEKTLETINYLKIEIVEL